MCKNCMTSSVPFKANQTIQVKRTIYKVEQVVSTPVHGIYLVDLTKVNDGSPYFGRWSNEVNAFLFVQKKAKNAGPTRLAALFAVSVN